MWSESTATAYFTVLATGDSLEVASPYAVDGEVDGVDPPNSSCAEVWQMPLAGIDTVDVTIRLDSVSTGSELDVIHSTGGLQYGDTGSVWTAQDSLFLSHDGSEASRVVVLLKDAGAQR